MSQRKRLTREDWIAAGLRALSQGGPDAVAIEPLASALETTKGSGYWHWSSRAELLDAVLERWVEVGTRKVIRDLDAQGGDAHQRLHRLLIKTLQTVVDYPGQLPLLVHLDPDVRERVKQATTLRLEYIRGLLTEQGFSSAEAKRRAVLAYATYLGLVQLRVSVPTTVPKSRAALAELTESLLAAVAG
ncbi:MAG: helix-turn-helix domain-containing protein [Polyangiaceae bacterium]